MIPAAQPKPKPKRAPSRGVAAGTLGGGGIATLAVWIFHEFFGIDVPAEVAASMGSVVGGLIQYFMRGGRQT